MKILAIFDSPDAEAATNSLRKQLHSVDVVPNLKSALTALRNSKYDVVLCQPHVGNRKISVLDHLRSIKSGTEHSDTPFICCDVSGGLTDEGLQEIAAEIHMLGGQGIIKAHDFNSRSLVHHIARHLSRAVASTCVTSKLY
ncbi:MAG: hypothetical protein WCT03_11475 [Candidatus Obscuribacterales bacterium]|jgi:DNA-binding response OmpR family regulator